MLVNVAVAVLLEKMVDTGGPAEQDLDLIQIKDLPEHAQALLQPLDLDNDGVINKPELVLAAELLRREQEGNKNAADLVSKVVDATREQVRTCIHDEMARTQSDLQLLRDETAARETRLLEALNQAASREDALKDSLQALTTSMQTLSAHASRPRRKAPPGAKLKARVAAHDTNGGGSGEEDKLQDGERTVSKQAPDRVQRV